MSYFLGVDIGSDNAKLALVDEDEGDHYYYGGAKEPCPTDCFF